ncbi:DUF4347 domain-containing protein [Massilia forsythiae]|uniref:DUF4347 domain-containing protein n=1 Tax=Massilia forsythiae TaxID=2728020 RepID=A0A7Z2VTM6_9BURK|nr:Ig-like domain-containing protein [Massilia forsythiae]QJD99008.1 DUF4347 domain-containing protein [Massilia forsythiae]
MNNRDPDFHPAAPRFPFPCADDGEHAIRLRLPVPVRHGGKEALLIDLALADRHVLAGGAPFGMEVTGFGGRHDGLAQLARWAALGDGYDALHLLCHGAAGRLMLGARTVDRAALDDPHVADALAAIGQAVRPGGAVLLYACRAAQGEEGAAFVAALAQALGVPVAASSTLVGAVAQGGSWALDHVAGIPVAGIPVAGIPAAGIPAAGDPVAGIGAAHALSATALAWPDYAHTLTVALNTTTFANVPFEANENYAQAASGYPTPTILSAANVARSGWDVTAQSSVNTGTFLIRGVGFNDNTGDGDGNSLRVQAADIDYVIFKSNANGFYFDLNNFAVVNNTTTPITVQAIDRAGNPVGAAVAFTVAGSEPAPKAYTHVSLAGNPDFVGIYGFKVTFDSASDAPFFDNLVIDNIGFPAVPTTTILDAALSADSGASAGDFVTNIAAQTIGGTLSAALLAGESVQVSYDGGATWNDATGFTAGSSAWSTGTTLAGSGTFMARVANGDGAGPAFSQAYVLDTDAPAAPSTPNLNSSSDTGFSGSDDITANTTPVVSGSAEDGSTVTLVDSDGSTVLGTATASGGAWSITASSLADGVHHLNAKAVDLAGNVSVASAALALTVDTAAPVGLAVSTAAVGTGDAGSGAAIATLSASDSTALKYLLAAGDGSNDADNASFAIAGNTLKVGGAALAAGTYHIHLAAVDAAGNVGYLAQDITVSASPTVGSIVRAGGAGAAVAASAASAEYTVTFSESVSGVDIGDFTLTGTGSAAGAIASVSGSGDTYVVTVDGLAGDGTLRLDLKAGATGIQNAGGTALGSGGYTAGATYTLDHTAPAAPAAPSLDSGSDSGASGSDGITNHTTPQISGSAEDGSTVTLYDSDGTTVLGTTTASGGAWSIVASALAQGSHHLTVKALDAAGNLSAASSALALTIDTAAPAGLALSAASAASLACFGGAALATLSAGDSTAVTYALAIGNGSNDADNATFSVAGDTLSVGSLALSAGTYHIYLSATDAAGNVSYLAQAFTVVDAPVASAIVRSGGAGAAVAAAAGSVEYTVHFSEAVSGVDAGDFTLNGSGSAGGAVAAVTGSGKVYTVTVDGLAGDGSLRLDLKADGTGIVNTHGIAIAGGYALGAGYVLDHTAPAAPSAVALDARDDSGVSSGDGITSVATPRISGIAEPDALVRLYDSNGVTRLGKAIAGKDGHWTIASDVLAAGSHSLTVRQFDAAGNASGASAALQVEIRTAAATLGAPLLDAASDSGIQGDGLTRIATPAVSGMAAPGAVVTLYDSDGVTVLGSASANPNGVWRIVSSALADGVHTLSARQTDVAGNVSPAGAALSLTIDTVAPAAPSMPALAAGSGAGVTAGERPLITGSALPDARVTLYDSDGSSVLGTATADAGGHWQITSPVLAVGKHLLTARQSDATGNVSDASTALALAVAAPAAPAPATTTIDGVQVTQQPVVLPGGGDGIRTIVPIVGADRSESAGGAATADIPLVSAGGNTLLLAQAGVGFGLSVSGGASRLAGNAVEQLIQSIKASTPDHPAADQGHLTGNAQGFLNTLAKQAALLVQTVTPVTAKDAANATLTLTGTSDATQHTALVIDAGGVGAGNTLVLKAVDFAAVIGAATVVGETAGQILTGDAASQTFVADSGLASLLFAGGGDDTLRLGTSAPSPSAQAHAAMAAAAPTLLHGGAGADTAVFAGARSAYTIDYHEGHVLVTANTGAHDQARVVNVETLQFQDGSVAVQDRAPLAAIAGLYADVLGRQADVGGFDYWGTVQKNGASLGAIALSLIGSSEGQARLQAFDGHAAHDVGILYQAIFNRTADAGGLAFWTEAVRHGATLEQVADQFMHSAEIVGHGIEATGWDFLV